MESKTHTPATAIAKTPPRLKSIRDLNIVESYDPGTMKPKYVTFYILTEEKELFFGQSFKDKRELSLEEFQAALEYVSDEEIYPEVSADIELTIAPEHLNDINAFVKQPGLNAYESMKGTEFIPRSILEETVIMEQLTRSPHPNFIHYHGCHVKRGRITAIVLERLEQTLTQLSLTPEYDQLDKINLVKALDSAVEHLHSLGLAHNDINPDNIMFRDGVPVLIDFGSCQPFGNRLQSLGTVGWYEKEFFTSEKEHDVYSMKILREWLKV